MKGNRPLLIVGIIIIALLVYQLMHLDDYLEAVTKDHFEYYFKKEISGLVTNKYLDTKNNEYKKVVVSGEGNREDYIIMNFEKSGLYNYIEIGDSIFKDSESLIINLKRGVHLDTSLTLKLYD